MNEYILPYDTAVDTFGDRILEIDSTSITYEDAFENSTFVDKALDLASDTGIPIEFTQFVLRKLAVDKVDCCSFEAALDPRAKRYFDQLIGPAQSERRQVHPGSPDQHCSVFRSDFTRLFCHKVITNLRNENCERDKFNKFARIFPFQVYRKVPAYKIGVLKIFDDDFYDQMQDFLDEHFDEKLPVRHTIALFLNNIRHFFETEYSSKAQSSEYLSTFPKLNDEGISYFQYLYKEYENVRRQFYNCRRRVPYLRFEKEKFSTMVPERNIDEISSLLQSITYRTMPDIYADIFEKYLFFFVHALQVENGPTPVFFIDDMLYQCLKSLHRFRTLRQDPINMVDDIAMMSLLCLLSDSPEISSHGRYSIDSTTLRYIKEYITSIVNPDIGVRFDFICELPFRINNEICFGVYFATKKYRCERGIMYFLHQLMCSVFSPDDNPTESIVCYSAHLGEESRFEIPRNIVESVKNFVRLSTKFDMVKVSHEPVNNVLLYLLRDRLMIPQT